ncbi:MAG: alpha/beta hydrolase, partial [Desulfobacterales bacterium]|nr:alpha/beta hydrolase [Desulfobacterales bacterium]
MSDKFGWENITLIHMRYCASFRLAASRISLLALLLLTLLLLSGCGFNHRVNPSFSLDYEDAKKQLIEMSQRPTELKRPVIVLGGWGDPGFVAASITKRMKLATGDDRVIAVNYFGTSGFNESARKTIKMVEKYFPSDDPLETVEVDVIGFSMGGLVGRYAAMPVTET